MENVDVNGVESLTSTKENLTLLEHVLVADGVETTGKCPLYVVNIDVKIVCSNLALHVESINIDPSLDLSGPIELLLN